ncbi:MAG: hypothetical protein IID34_08615 [Planctomycetes bacterium]|nr:hypothetical protein [Planctomycetota bacterium]
MNRHSAHSRFVQRRGQTLMRSVRLAIISLAVVGLAFGVYQIGLDPVVEEDIEPADVPPVFQDLLAGDPESVDPTGSVKFGDVPVKVVRKPGITIREEGTGRKKLHMRFDNPRQVDDTGMLFHIDNPIVTYYRKTGEKVVIRADEALIASREPNKIDPQRGEFIGHVRIDLDRRTTEWLNDNPDLADRPPPHDQLARMWVSKMDFDLDLGFLNAPGPVRIEANEMLLEGEDLTVSWNAETGRIEQLELATGKQLIFKGDFGLGQGLTERNKQEKTEQPNTTAARQGSSSGVGHASPQTPEVETSMPSAEMPGTEDDVLIVDIQPDDPTTMQKAVGYVIEFGSDVLAEQQGDSPGMLRADQLSVLFDFLAGGLTAGNDLDARDEAQSGQGRDPVPAADLEDRTVVTWSGPLKIRAIGEVDDATAPLRRHVTARGAPVVLENADFRSTSAEFEYHQETGYTRFVGDAKFPAELNQGAETSFAARGSIVWDMRQLTANLREDVQVLISGAALQGESIDAIFRPPPKDADLDPEELLQKLVCRGAVQLTTSAESVSCNEMTVDFEVDATGRNVPRHAHAVGDVEVTQGQRVLTAGDVMDVIFGSVPTDEGGNVLQEMPNLRELEASGGVRILDPSRGWDIAGSKLKCVFDAQGAITYGYIEGLPGERARVKMGEYYIEGETVTFDGVREWAHVPGPGIARFVIQEDLDGRRTDKPVPVEVRWDREMTLRGKDNILEFDGNVVATSRNVTLTGRIMRVSLADIQPEPSVQLASADPMGLWFLKPFEADLEQVGTALGTRPKRRRPARQGLRKRATYILADGDARLVSRTQSTTDGRLESLVLLRSPQIAFDLEARVMNIEQAGVLVIEDYPAVEDIAALRQQRNPGLFSETQSEGPSQTLIKWDAGMRYYFRQRVAQFEGSDEPVYLGHVSGSHIKMNPARQEEIQVTEEQLEQLRSSGLGRVTELSCDELLVQFRRSLSRSGRGAGEMSIGELRQFQANGNVVLKDLEWHVTGQRLDYVDDSQLISVYGFGGQDAYVNYLNRKTNRYRIVECPELHIEMKTGRVDAPAGCDIREGGR